MPYNGPPAGSGSYNPGINYHGDQYLAAGISRGLGNVLGYIMGKKAEGDQLRQQRTVLQDLIGNTDAAPPASADGSAASPDTAMADNGGNTDAASAEEEQWARAAKAAKSGRDLLTSLGLRSKEQVATMGLPEVLGHIQGVAVQRQQQQDALKEQETMARIQEMAAQGRRWDQTAKWRQAEMDQQAKSTAAVGNLARNALGAIYESGQGSPGQISVLESLRQQPEAASSVHSLLPFLMPNGETNGNVPIDFQEDPITGARFARMGKMMQNSGINPAKVTGAETIVDEQGNEYPVTRDPRTQKATMLRSKAAITATAKPVRDVMGQPTGEYEVNYSGDPAAVADFIAQQKKPQSPGSAKPKDAPATAAPAAPAPKIVIMTGPKGEQMPILESKRAAFLKTYPDFH